MMAYSKWVVLVVLALGGSSMYAQDSPDSSVVAITETSQAIAKARALYRFDTYMNTDAPVVTDSPRIQAEKLRILVLLLKARNFLVDNNMADTNY